MLNANILLEDGTKLQGTAIGAEGTVCGEIVFNTGMTGYQEILTDPSYAEQIVVMTYPLIGNYGINSNDIESNKPQVKGFIIKEYCENPNNWKNEQNISDYLKQHNIFAVTNIDTRMLTKKIRSKGAMKCLLTTKAITESIESQLVQYKFPADIVLKVSRKNVLKLNNSGKKHIAVIDFGIKNGIIRQLQALHNNITIFPCDTSSKDILSINPDAVLFSNGPGDPKDIPISIKTAQELIGRLPIFGICLGHQILCLALGGDTYKLKFGHRGSNHPVINLQTNKVIITSQNHGYAINQDSLDKNTIITYQNINDGTVEGFSNEIMNIHTVQFHPEAGPGPQDATFLFSEWMKKLGEKHYAQK